MKSDREARYPTAADLRADLAPMLPGPMQTPRHGARLLVAVAVVAALVMAGFAWSSRNRRGTPPVVNGGSGTVENTVAPAAASTQKPFINTLGMKFVPVPIVGGPTRGERVLFSVWAARVQDYGVFAKETQREWIAPPFSQGPEHPAVKVSWEDATAFCEWLTARERKAGRLGADHAYRLPSDHEWSCAVGIGEREDAAELPGEKNGRIGDTFPWGTQWPPPDKAGNYAGGELQPLLDAGKYMSLKGVIADYLDGFTETSPVGSFPANRFGLHDMGGDTWQWCAEWFDRSQTERVLRGASWYDSDRNLLLSSHRHHSAPALRNYDYGFRCVLAMAAPKPAGAAAYPAGQWVKVFSNLEKVPGVSAAKAGWVRFGPEAPALVVPSQDGGNRTFRNAGVRARFQAKEASFPRWAKLEVRKGASRMVPSLRYIPPATPADSAEMRIELTLDGGRKFLTLATAPAEMAMGEGEAYTMELYAIGGLLIGRMNEQTLTARIENPDVLAEGAFGIWGADRNFFRDFEVMNLDGLPEAEAMKLAGVGEK
jgi:hypothetical protein